MASLLRLYSDMLRAKMLSSRKLVQLTLLGLFEIHNAVWSPGGEGVEAGVDAHSQAVLMHGLELHFQSMCILLQHLILSPTALQSLAKAGASEEQQSGGDYYYPYDGHAQVQSQADEVEQVLPSLGIFADWMLAYPELWKEWWSKRNQKYSTEVQGRADVRGRDAGEDDGLRDFWSSLGVVLTSLQHSYDAQEWHSTGMLVYESTDTGTDLDSDLDGNTDGERHDAGDNSCASADDDVPRDLAGSDSESEGYSDDGDGGDGSEGQDVGAAVGDENSDNDDNDGDYGDSDDLCSDDSNSDEDDEDVDDSVVCQIVKFKLHSELVARNIALWEDETIRGFLPLERVSTAREASDANEAAIPEHEGNDGASVPLPTATRTAEPSPFQLRRMPVDMPLLRIPEESAAIQFECRRLRVLSLGYAVEHLQFDSQSRVHAVPVAPRQSGAEGGDATDEGDSDQERPIYSPRTPTAPWLPPLCGDGDGDGDGAPCDDGNVAAGAAGAAGADDARGSDDGDGASDDGDRTLPASPTPFEKLHTQREMLQTQLETHVAVAAEQQHFTASVLASYNTPTASLLRVKPQYLFPDTNCFLNMLGKVRSLIEDPAAFKVMVPLTVVNELYGLTKGSVAGGSSRMVERDGKAATLLEDVVASVHTATALTKAATAAVSFLEAEFASHAPRIRAVTCMGTQMRSIEYRSETAEQGKTNDDMILQSCAKFQDANRKQVVAGDCTVDVFTAVLITGDTNLRLKAHALPLPAIGLADFCKRVSKARA